MTYYMNLCEEPFEKIRWLKTIEMRINDERRKNLKAQDLIEFRNVTTGQTLSRRIKNIYYFPSFKELYEHFPKKVLGYGIEEIANYKDMLLYYNEADIAKYGAIAIELTSLIE